MTINAEIIGDLLVQKLADAIYILNPNLKISSKKIFICYIRRMAIKAREEKFRQCFSMLRTVLLYIARDNPYRMIKWMLNLTVRLLPLSEWQDNDCWENEIPEIDTPLRNFGITSSRVFHLPRNKREALLVGILKECKSHGTIHCPITWENLLDTDTKRIKPDVVALFEESSCNADSVVELDEKINPTISDVKSHGLSKWDQCDHSFVIENAERNQNRSKEKLVEMHFEKTKGLPDFHVFFFCGVALTDWLNKISPTNPVTRAFVFSTECCRLSEQ